jgi:hypothetical protein
MPAAVAARAAGDGRPAAAAKPFPGEAAAADADGWSALPGVASEVAGPAAVAKRWASAEAAGAVIVVMVLPGKVLLPPGVVTVVPGAVPAPPGAVPAPPGGLTTPWTVPSS